MKKNIEKIYNISTSTIFSIYALIALILTIFIPKYNILFNGWWALIILIPSLGSLLFQKNKLGSLYLFIVGIFILLVSNSIISINKCFTILACLGIIFIGINIVKSTIKIPNNISSITKYVPLFYAFLGSTEEKIDTNFYGGYTKVICGYLLLDLRDSKIEKGSTLKVLSIFGETEIILPSNIEVITNSTNILGGVENLKKSSKKSKNNNQICIESISILGSTKIK